MVFPLLFFLFIYSPIIVNTIVTFGYTATGDLSKLYYLSFSEEIRNHSVRGGEWSFKNYESHKVLVGFHTSRSLVFLAVMCVSQSGCFHESSRSLDFLQE